MRTKLSQAGETEQGIRAHADLGRNSELPHVPPHKTCRVVGECSTLQREIEQRGGMSSLRHLWICKPTEMLAGVGKAESEARLGTH